jgi:hypothetical protein
MTDSDFSNFCIVLSFSLQLLLVTLATVYFVNSGIPWLVPIALTINIILGCALGFWLGRTREVSSLESGVIGRFTYEVGYGTFGQEYLES